MVLPLAEPLEEMTTTTSMTTMPSEGPRSNEREATGFPLISVRDMVINPALREHVAVSLDSSDTVRVVNKEKNKWPTWKKVLLVFDVLLAIVIFILLAVYQPWGSS